MSKQNKNIIIIKASGEKALFDDSKLKRSLKRSGANDKTVKEITGEVKALLHDGITTKEIYKKAYKLLRKSSGPHAARYKLKKAIYELGPTGYPFEKFVAAILKDEGYEIITNVTVQGHCVKHEVDVVAEKEEKHFMVECKFHITQGQYCDVKIPLYIHSRFKDIEKQWKKQPGHETKFHQGWIVTNTRFSSDAILFGNCSGLMLIGWNYPKKGSLNDRIDRAGLYPVTSLTALTDKEKQELLEKEIILCRTLYNNPSELKNIGIKSSRLQKIMDECSGLCEIKTKAKK